MSRPRKKGEFLLVCAVGALLGGAGAGYMAVDVNKRMGKLRQNGVVSAAQITARRFHEERGTKITGGGRAVSRHTTDYTFDLMFDKRAITPHTAFMAGRSIETDGRPNFTPARIDVSRAVFAAHKQGDVINVTFIPDIAPYDKNSFQLTETVERQSSFGFLVWWYLGALAGIVAGAWGIARYRRLNRRDA